MSNESDRRKRGLAVYKEMGWGDNPAVKELDPDLYNFTTDVLTVVGQPGSVRDLITV